MTLGCCGYLSEVSCCAPTEQEDLGFPAVLDWHGVRFTKADPHQGEVVRYESEHMLFSGWLKLIGSGQWIAAFTNGLCSIEWDPEEALESACRKNIDYLQYKISRFQELAG